MGSGNRTVICTVVFIDIVEFSKKAVAEQLRIKDQLNQLLAAALKEVPVRDRIILDTGDGAAVSFLGEPEDGLYLGFALRDALAAGDGSLQLRTGINLGPVRMVRDINNQPNIIGDGINVAQRVMGFAATNQVLVSRSYYEVVSALSGEYAKLFSHEGVRTDKHVREHEIYALGSGAAPQRAPRRKAAHEAAFEKLGSTASTAHLGMMRRPWLTTTLTVILILVSAVAIRQWTRKPAPAPADAPVSAKPADAALQAAAPVRTEPETVPAKPPAKPKTAPKKETVPDNADAATTTGTVRLSILPWGEVYVDDRKYGVAPPLRDVALKPGSHRIEVRNPGFASYVQVVDIKAGEEIRIRHQFK